VSIKGVGIMPTKRSVVAVLSLFVFLGFGALSRGQETQGKYMCTEANPEQVCVESNTCGLAGACTVNIKRTAGSASVTPDAPAARANAPFCVKVGQTVTWKSASKDTGFMLDFGPTSPFSVSGAIMGGSERPVAMVARRKGCYKFSAGACASGATYGKCQSVESELIVVGNDK